MWSGPKGELEYLVNVMWPLTPFTAGNGGTRLWPGSHLVQDVAELPEGDAIAPSLRPGDALLFLGSTLHGGGGNRTDRPRRGIIVSYCLGWLKPFELQWLIYPPEIARNFDPELAALVGYAQHRPNLGNVEGQCPSVLLHGNLPDHLAAIDALRPDQEIELAQFVAEQRGGEKRGD
jgi:ectoine hydroxylase-related dioxygenase (phytanoyl-CoA dioxygenase family)